MFLVSTNYSSSTVTPELFAETCCKEIQLRMGEKILPRRTLGHFFRCLDITTRVPEVRCPWQTSEEVPRNKTQGLKHLKQAQLETRPATSSVRLMDTLVERRLSFFMLYFCTSLVDVYRSLFLSLFSSYVLISVCLFLCLIDCSSIRVVATFSVRYAFRYLCV